MIISELIYYLETVKKEHGDITVCTAKDHEYWGRVYNHIDTKYNIRIDSFAQPEGPKSGVSEKALVFNYC